MDRPVIGVNLKITRVYKPVPPAAPVVSNPPASHHAAAAAPAAPPPVPSSRKSLALAGMRALMAAFDAKAKRVAPDWATAETTTTAAAKTAACSAVTARADHFGPIGPEHDHSRGTGVSIGARWASRTALRDWGIHRPLVATVGGQPTLGAQSVLVKAAAAPWLTTSQAGVITGPRFVGEGAWVGGNAALRQSCLRGLPVRVVIDHGLENHGLVNHGLENHGLESPRYAYAGVYLVARCWRVVNAPASAPKCRFLLVRCDPGAGDTPESVAESMTQSMAESLPERAAAAGGGAPGETAAAFWGWGEAQGAYGWRKPRPSVAELRRKAAAAETDGESGEDPQMELEVASEVESEVASGTHSGTESESESESVYADADADGTEPGGENEGEGEGEEGGSSDDGDDDDGGHMHGDGDEGEAEGVGEDDDEPEGMGGGGAAAGPASDSDSDSDSDSHHDPGFDFDDGDDSEDSYPQSPGPDAGGRSGDSVSEPESSWHSEFGSDGGGGGGARPAAPPSPLRFLPDIAGDGHGHSHSHNHGHGHSHGQAQAAQPAAPTAPAPAAGHSMAPQLASLASRFPRLEIRYLATLLADAGGDAESVAKALAAMEEQPALKRLRRQLGYT